MSTAAATAEPIAYRSPAGRWVLLATIMGSGMAMLDGTVVNVALPTIGRELSVGITGLQWTVNAYTLTLAGLLLLGGSLGDRYGRRRLFVAGVVWFAMASMLCGLAPNGSLLIAARALQGVGGALLTPGSLAIIQANFRPEDRGAAVGAWSGFGGVAAAIGPFLGGYLVQALSWRWIFFINVPVAAAVAWIATMHIPETHDPEATGRVDVPGALLAALGLAGLTYALTEGPRFGWLSPVIVGSLVGGALLFIAFVAAETRERHPMLPLELFASRQFTAANLVTLVVYAALIGGTFLIPIELQRVVGMTPLQSGTAIIPITAVMLLFSARAGRLAARIGPRLPMCIGPLLMAAGLAMLARLGPGSSFLIMVLPSQLVFAAGLTLTVAPLTSTVLAAASEHHAGIASAVNNAVARTAGLLAVAILPVAAGLTGAEALQPEVFGRGFRMAMIISATLCALGGLLALVTIKNPREAEKRQEERRLGPLAHQTHCAMDAPPLRR